MNTPDSSASRRPVDSQKSKTPLVSPDKAAREKAKLHQGRERLEEKPATDQTSVRSSVAGEG